MPYRIVYIWYSVCMLSITKRQRPQSGQLASQGSQPSQLWSKGFAPRSRLSDAALLAPIWGWISGALSTYPSWPGTNSHYIFIYRIRSVVRRIIRAENSALACRWICIWRYLHFAKKKPQYNHIDTHMSWRHNYGCECIEPLLYRYTWYEWSKGEY